MLQSMDDTQLNIPKTRNSHAKYMRSPMAGNRTSAGMRSNNNMTYSPRKYTPRKLRSTVSTPVLRPGATKRVLRTRASKLDLLDKSQITSFPSPYRLRDAPRDSSRPYEVSPSRPRTQVRESPFHPLLHARSQILPQQTLSDRGELRPISSQETASDHRIEIQQIDSRQIDSRHVEARHVEAQHKEVQIAAISRDGSFSPDFVPMDGEHMEFLFSEPMAIIEDYIPRPLRRDSEMYGPLEIEQMQHDETWREYLWKKLRWRWRVQGLLHS